MRTLLLVLLTIPASIFAGPAPSSTQLNQAISRVMGGGFVGEVIGEAFDKVSDFWLALPFDMEPVESQVAHFLQKEGARWTRNLISKELGLGPLSVSSAESGSSFMPSSASRRGAGHPLSFKTSVSSRRLALSLIFRF